MHPLLKQLDGNDLRKIDRSEQVAAEVLERLELFQVLIDGLNYENPGVRMRA